MILIDLSQFLIGILTGSELVKEFRMDNPLAENHAKHLFFMSFLKYKKKFSDYGKIVICCDKKPYWRKGVFKYYKANRQADKDESYIDWKFIYHVMDSLIEDLKLHFPYKVIHIAGAEADDCIGVICKYLQSNDLVRVGIIEEPEKVVILSGDGDHVQCQVHKNVVQYSPRLNKFITHNGSLRDWMCEHIVKGDSGDGIPNILSQDDCFVSKIRQTAIKKPYLQKFLDDGVSACTTDLERKNWERNRTLVDYDCIPDHISTAIINSYKSDDIVGSKAKIRNYFMSNRMKLLFEELQYF